MNEFNEFEHLKILGNKHDVGELTMGAFWVLFCVLQERCLISFERWLVAFIEHRKVGLSKDYIQYTIEDAKYHIVYSYLNKPEWMVRE